MISEIYIDNFKLYNDQTISLSPLTILTGMNGMGKSSLIQSLLLLRQSQSSNSNLKKGLNLVGDLYRPGQSIDVKSQSNPNASMQIKLTFDHNQAPLDFRFTYTGNEDSIILGDENNVSDDDILKQYSLFNKSFQYISAFRLGPQINDYDKDDSIVKELGQISKMYGMCEYAMHFLLHNGTKQIGVSNLAIKSEGEDENLKLNEQVDRWMHRITRNVFVDVNSPNEKVRLRYKFMGEGAQTLKAKFSVSTMGRRLVTIFVSPASLDELKDRLIKRGTDDEPTIQKRLQTAETELHTLPQFDYHLCSQDRAHDWLCLQHIYYSEKMRI